ncbi:MAG TPA: hypothetical protein VEV39_11945 [Gemmatimonadales bacterium]|nr:hypothetical protein [Gemmatimonadales bacterium]
MRRLAIGLLIVAAVAACDPTTDEGILGFGVGGGGGGGDGGGTAGVATHLVFTQQPATTQATAAMPSAVVVQAEDGLGQVDTTYSGVVTLMLSSNPDSATLGGNFSVSALNGVATFSNLTIDKADTGYVLSAASGSLTIARSSKFAITP